MTRNETGMKWTKWNGMVLHLNLNKTNALCQYITVTVDIAADINRLQFPKSKMEGQQI